MRIHILGHTTSGSGLQVTKRGHFSRGSFARQRLTHEGTGLRGEIYDNTLNRVSDLLNKVHISKPHIQKKYISFDL